MTDALMPRSAQPVDDASGLMTRPARPANADEVSEPEANLARLTGKLTTNRGRVYAFIPLVLFALCFAVAARSWVGFGNSVDGGIPVGLFTQTDFPAVVIASRLVASGPVGSGLYDPTAQLEEQHLLTRQGYLLLPPDDPVLHYPYPYPPFLALAWAPFTALSPLTGMALWDLFNLAALIIGMLVLMMDLPLPRMLRYLLLLAALTCFPWIVNLEQGQTSGLVLLAMALGVVALRRYHEFTAGLAFGLLFFKIQWLPFIVLMLVVKARWRALVGLAVAGMALALEATFVLGPGWLPAYIQVLTTAAHSGQSYLLTPAASHSLDGGIFALLGPAHASLVGPLAIAGTLLVVALVVWAWLYTPRANLLSPLHLALTWQPGTPTWDAHVALTLMAAILTNLQLNTHDLALLIVPVTLGFSALYDLWAERAIKGKPLMQSRLFPALWYGCLWLLYLAPLLLFLLVNNILDPIQPFPIRLTTWLMVLMLGLLTSLGVRTVRET